MAMQVSTDDGSMVENTLRLLYCDWTTTTPPLPPPPPPPKKKKKKQNKTKQQQQQQTNKQSSQTLDFQWINILH